MPLPPRPERPDLMRVLRGVSRSFFLSIRLLPAGMREPVAVGYLLARASDTIADTAAIDAASREAMLSRWRELVAAEPIAGREQAAASLGNDFALHQTDESEQALMRALAPCLRALDALPPADADDVRDVLGHITRGQALDVARFGRADAAEPMQLRTVAELDEYTWLVAGCVGEFWTRLALRHVPRFTSIGAQQMLDWGRSYGQALQLVNILRDRVADEQAGRRYLPVEAPSPQRWIAQAQAGLDDGMRHALAVRPVRLRCATALPALIGVRTLALVRRGDSHAKLPRSQVRALLWRVMLTLGDARVLRADYARERLSSAGWDNSAP